MSDDAGLRNKRIRIERPVADDAPDGAGSGTWSLVATVSAQVTDILPSRGEKLADGINVASRPARVRIRYRADINIDASMRFLLIRKQGDAEIIDRVMQIVAGPAELGFRERVEFMVEDYSTAGNPA